MKNSTLEKLLEIEKIKDHIHRKKAAGNVMESVKLSTTPVFDQIGKALFIYEGECESAGLIGDMTDWVDTIPLTRLEGTSIFYLELNFPEDARLQYFFKIDSGSGEESELITDPYNPFKVRNGLWLMSEMAMPSYLRNPLFNGFAKGEQSGFDNLFSHSLSAGALPYIHEINVYLPPGYRKENNGFSVERYSVIYFQDGPDYIKFAHVPHILDSLINNHKIEPVIAVFVTPPNLHQPVEPNRSTEYGLNKNYLYFFTNELVPFIDRHYLTLEDSQARMVVGDSYGGLISTWIAFCRPDLFGYAYSQSGYHSFSNDTIINKFMSSEIRNFKLFMDIGTYETRVGADFIPQKETAFLAANRRFKKILSEKGYNFDYREYNEGHTWGNWREHLISVIKEYSQKRLMD